MAIPRDFGADEVPRRASHGWVAVSVKLETSHSSPKTRGLFCDGQPCFEVLMRRGKKTESERYYCAELRGYFEPSEYGEGNCPKCIRPKPKKPKGFNRGYL